MRQPALIVHPRNDDMASLKNAQYLQAHLGGLVDTLVLDDSYHMVTLDQQRHVVAERTDAFVSWVENGYSCQERAAAPDKGAKADHSRIASDRGTFKRCAPAPVGSRHGDAGASEASTQHRPSAQRCRSLFARFQVKVSPRSLMPR